jgi:UDP-N-acetylglucosamine 2-epimerase (non-hydrolysing)
MKKVMLVFGTRPEAIKMCPLINELKSRSEMKTIVCVTGQHREMLDQVLHAFSVIPDYDLSIMLPKQTLFDITTNILNRIKSVLEEVKPDCRQHRNFRHFQHSNFPDWKRHGFPAFWKKVLFKRN